MKYTFVFILSLLSLSIYGQNTVKGNLKYDIYFNLIKGKLNITYGKEALSNDTLKLIFNAKANIKSLKGRGVLSYDFSELHRIGNQRKNKLLIAVDTLLGLDSYSFEMEYNIREFSNYLHQQNWIEMHSEFNAIPYDFESIVDYDIYLTMPEEFKVIGNGNLKELAKGEYHLVLKDAEFVPTIFGGTNILTKNDPNSPYPDLEVHSYFDEYNMMDTIYSCMINVLEYYHKTFAKNSPKSDFAFAIVPFVHNFSFQRDGFAISRYFNQGDRFINRIPYALKTPFHEVGHLWWAIAPSDTYDNWLNESFAEYFSYLAIREIYGEDKFTECIESCEKKVGNYGPIVDFESPYTSILYDKGTYIVYELHKKLGEDDFIGFSRKLVDRQIDSVNKCIDLVKSEYSSETAEWLYNRLRE